MTTSETTNHPIEQWSDDQVWAYLTDSRWWPQMFRDHEEAALRALEDTDNLDGDSFYEDLSLIALILAHRYSCDPEHPEVHDEARADFAPAFNLEVSSDHNVNGTPQSKVDTCSISVLIDEAEELYAKHVYTPEELIPEGTAPGRDSAVALTRFLVPAYATLHTMGATVRHRLSSHD